MLDNITNYFKSLPKWLKSMVGLIGALIAGALGNGFWEFLLYPALKFLGRGSVDFLVSISSVFSRYIYTSIARASDANETLLILAVLSFVVILPSFINMNSSSLRTQDLIKSYDDMIMDTNRMTSELERRFYPKIQPEITEEEARQRADEAIARSKEMVEEFEHRKKFIHSQASKSRKRINFYIAIFIVNILFNGFISAYVKNKVADFQIAFERSKPNLTTLEEDTILARFRNIEDRIDYSNIMEFLERRQYPTKTQN